MSDKSCLCGCGTKIKPTSNWAPGHDMRAKTKLLVGSPSDWPQSIKEYLLSDACSQSFRKYRIQLLEQPLRDGVKFYKGLPGPDAVEVDPEWDNLPEPEPSAPAEDPLAKDLDAVPAPGTMPCPDCGATMWWHAFVSAYACDKCGYSEATFPEGAPYLSGSDKAEAEGE